MTESIQIIPQLLHDARLFRLDWEPTVRSLRLHFTCLMRNVDGSTIPDPVIELHLNGIERIAAYYSPASVEVRPSELHIQSPLNEMDLHEWSQDSCEAFLSINSAHNDFLMTTSCVLDWLFSDQPEKCNEDKQVAHVPTEHPLLDISMKVEAEEFSVAGICCEVRRNPQADAEILEHSKLCSQKLFQYFLKTDGETRASYAALVRTIRGKTKTRLRGSLFYPDQMQIDGIADEPSFRPPFAEYVEQVAECRRKMGNS